MVIGISLCLQNFHFQRRAWRRDITLDCVSVTTHGWESIRRIQRLPHKIDGGATWRIMYSKFWFVKKTVHMCMMDESRTKAPPEKKAPQTKAHPEENPTDKNTSGRKHHRQKHLRKKGPQTKAPPEESPTNKSTSGRKPYKQKPHNLNTFKVLIAKCINW